MDLGNVDFSCPSPAWGSWLRHAEGQLQTDEKAGESRECSSFAGILLQAQLGMHASPNLIDLGVVDRGQAMGITLRGVDHHGTSGLSFGTP